MKKATPLVHYDMKTDDIIQNIIFSADNGLPILCIGNKPEDKEYYEKKLGDGFAITRMTPREANRILQTILGKEANGINIGS